MLTRKTYLILFVSIVSFVIGYLYYTKVDREQSIIKYFDHPRLGDIYKIQDRDEDGHKWVHYLKVTEVSERGLAFAPGKLKSNGSSDYLLKHFDELQPTGYTYQELKEIRDGKWNNNLHNNTTLIEIARK